ncbi:catalase [Paraburkholderia youngii]|uniref:catalase n=1 Tax=Paraburkholderia youngii TaxID=2782701 RepID=UPI003D1BA624
MIPERRIHAKGPGAFGTLEVTHDISLHKGQLVRADRLGNAAPPRLPKNYRHMHGEFKSHLKWV